MTMENIQITFSWEYKLPCMLNLYTAIQKYGMSHDPSVDT